MVHHGPERAPSAEAEHEGDGLSRVQHLVESSNVGVREPRVNGDLLLEPAPFTLRDLRSGDHLGGHGTQGVVYGEVHLGVSALIDEVLQAQLLVAGAARLQAFAAGGSVLLRHR